MKPHNINIDWAQVYADVDEDYYSDDFEEDNELPIYNPLLSVDAFVEYFVDEPGWLNQAIVKLDENFFINISFHELIDLNILCFHKRGLFNTCQLYKKSFEYYLTQTQSVKHVHDMFQFLLMTLQRQKLSCNKEWLIYMIKNFKASDNFKNFWSRDCAHIFGKILKLVGDKHVKYLPYWYSHKIMECLDIDSYETCEPKHKDVYDNVIKYVKTKDGKLWMVKLKFQKLAWRLVAIFPVNEYIERYNVLNSEDGTIFKEFLGSCPVLKVFDNVSVPENIKQNLNKTNNNWATSFRCYNDDIHDSIWNMFD
jgi:hypothetical protein